MKVFITILSFLILVPALGAASDKDASLRNVLEQAHLDFQDLALDLPFEKISGGREQAVRERFKDATRTLMEAGREVGQDNGKSRELTRDALNKYRRVGLLLPFYEIDLPDEAMDKYLAAEDRLFFAMKVFEGSEQPPQNEDAWRYNGQAWKALKGVYSLREAQEKCAAVIATQTTGWHVPSVDELSGALVAMKSPTRNPIFGAEASTFREVWTGQANPQSPGTYYFVDFQTGQTGVAGPLGSYHVACVGKDGVGSPVPPPKTPPETPVTPPPPAVASELEGTWRGECDRGSIRHFAFWEMHSGFARRHFTIPRALSQS